MFARVLSGGLLGIDAYRIEVEVDCSGGIGQIQIVGLPDAAVREAQERVRTAIKSCSFLMPTAKKWVVNLAPADTRKEGPAYDMPIAIGILAASGLLPIEYLSQFYLVGELGLDGSLRPVPGVLPIAIHSKTTGATGIIVPEQNADEAQLVENLRVYPVSHLKQVCQIIQDPEQCPYLSGEPRKIFSSRQSKHNYDLDFSDVKGQHLAKRAMEIAAAGKHNILLVGPPGSGKSMLAQRLPGIMPALSFEEALELTKLYSAAGFLPAHPTQNQRATSELHKETISHPSMTSPSIHPTIVSEAYSPHAVSVPSLVLERPFRNPHHSASSAGLVGGGTYPRPGEISLSHMGILFLDELTEFPRHHLDLLRQPLENGCITISRCQHTLSYPASFLLVGACNPCPCGYLNDPVKTCICSPYQAARYWARLSGPLLDRFDLHIEVPRLNEDELGADTGEDKPGKNKPNKNKTGNHPDTSENIRLRVERAVACQKERFGDGSCTYNGQLSHRQVKQSCRIDEKSRQLLVKAVCQFGLSARSFDRLLRVARTVADLDASEAINSHHVAEALKYRLRSEQQPGRIPHAAA